MIVGYLLLGVLATCGNSHPPRQGDSRPPRPGAPAPNITLDKSLIVEGDIAVTESSDGSGLALNAFRTAQSLISLYEVHFGPGRQLDQENAHMEMYTAENGPILVQADPLIKRALDKYWQDHNQRGGGKWRMYHTDETHFYQPDDSKSPEDF